MTISVDSKAHYKFQKLDIEGKYLNTIKDNTYEDLTANITLGGQKSKGFLNFGLRVPTFPSNIPSSTESVIETSRQAKEIMNIKLERKCKSSCRYF